jgi:hypothetical protein
MVAGRKPPTGDEQHLLRLVEQNLAATSRMEKAFVAMGKRVHEGNEIQGQMIELMRELLDGQRRQSRLLHHQSLLLGAEAALLRAILAELGHALPGHPYPRPVGVTVKPVCG